MRLFEQSLGDEESLATTTSVEKIELIIWLEEKWKVSGWIWLNDNCCHTQTLESKKVANIIVQPTKNQANYLVEWKIRGI